MSCFGFVSLAGVCFIICVVALLLILEFDFVNVCCICCCVCDSGVGLNYVNFAVWVYRLVWCWLLWLLWFVYFVVCIAYLLLCLLGLFVCGSSSCCLFTSCLNYDRVACVTLLTWWFGCLVVSLCCLLPVACLIICLRVIEFDWLMVGLPVSVVLLVVTGLLSFLLWLTVGGLLFVWFVF